MQDEQMDYSKEIWQEVVQSAMTRCKIYDDSSD